MNQTASGIGHKQHWVWELLTAALFSFFMVFGRAFESNGDWKTVLQGWPVRLLSAGQFLFWLLLFFVAISCLYTCWDSNADSCAGRMRQIGELPFGKRLLHVYDSFASRLYQHPFATTFLTLAIKNIPYYIASYPCIFMGDAQNQVRQMLGIIELNNHHPIIHTMVIGFFLKLHDLIGWNNCMFLYGIFQTVLVFAVMSACISLLVTMKTKRLITCGVLFFYMFQPRIENYLFLLSKDTIYSAFFALFVLGLSQFLSSQEKLKKYELFRFGLSIAGMICFRNEGKFIVIGTLLVALIIKCRPGRKQIAVFLLLALLISSLISKVLCSALNLETDTKEMLSVPFQQTARYVKEYGDEVTEEERQAIDAVLDYDSLAEKYRPNISDPVKGTYRRNNEALPEYFRIWFQMLLKHPGAYIRATMANYYQYFYPGDFGMDPYTYSWSATCIEDVNEKTGVTDFSQPKAIEPFRQALESARETYAKAPLLAALNQPAVYVWLAILCIVYAVRGRSLNGFVFVVPIIIHILILITGPTNGYYARYEIPMVFYLPVVLILLPHIVRMDASKPAICQKQR